MSTPLALISGALLALLPWSATLQEQETGLRPRVPPRDPALLAELMHERIQGCWQLTRVVYKDQPILASNFAGYMIVTSDHLSIDLHLLLNEAFAGPAARPFFQSGIHRWRFAGENNLETSSLIGTTNVTENLLWTFEKPGTIRNFQLNLTSTTISLERPGESRMEFRKMPNLPFPGQQLQFELEQTEAARAAQTKARAGDSPVEENED